MIILLGLMACGGPYVAEFGSSVTAAPDALIYQMGCRYARCSQSCSLDDYANEGAYLNDCDPVDGIGNMVQMTALVVAPVEENFVEGSPEDPGQLKPKENIAVTVYSNSPNIYVIPEAAIEVVQGPYEACIADPTAEGCPEFFDAETQQFFEVAGTYTTPVSDTGAPFRPNMMTGQTNRHGVMPFYVFVDQAPAPGGTVDIVVDIQVNSTSIQVSTGTGS